MGTPRLTFENTVSKILEEGHVKSLRTPPKSMSEKVVVCRFSLTTPLGIKRKASLVFY